MTLRPIILIEDNPDDERLTIRALRRGNVVNEILVARNGEEALLMVLQQIPIKPATKGAN